MTQLLEEAATYAPKALPPHLAGLVAQQLTAAIHTHATNYGAFVATDQMEHMLALAGDVLALPPLLTPDADLVQAAARAMWVTDYPPTGHMSWEQATEKGLVDHHLQHAAAAVTALKAASTDG
jgi:hypothetical protein